jgi:hypothetical protein
MVPRGLGFVHHSIAILYHEVPQTLISRFATFSSQYGGAWWQGGTPDAGRLVRRASSHAGGQRGGVAAVREPHQHVGHGAGRRAAGARATRATRAATRRTRAAAVLACVHRMQKVASRDVRVSGGRSLTRPLRDARRFRSARL